MIGSSHFEEGTYYSKIRPLNICCWATYQEYNHNDDHNDNHNNEDLDDIIMKITSGILQAQRAKLQFKIYLQSIHGIVLAITIDNNLRCLCKYY